MERWGNIRVRVNRNGIMDDVTGSLVLDSESVKFSWGRDGALEDPKVSQFSFTLVNGDGAFTPLAFPGWKRGAPVELWVGDPITEYLMWRGTVDTLTPGWGGSDSPLWSRVQVTALGIESGWAQTTMGSMFSHHIRGGAWTAKATNYWPLEAGGANTIEAGRPLIAAEWIVDKALTFGTDTAPLGDGNIAYLARDGNKTGDAYFRIDSLTVPGVVLLWGSARSPDPSTGHNGLISFRAGNWFYAIEANFDRRLSVTSLDNGEPLSGARSINTNIWLNTDEPFLLMVNLATGGITVVRMNTGSAIFAWPTTPSSDAYRPPPPGTSVTMMVGAVDRTVWDTSSTSPFSWKGTLGRVTTYAEGTTPMTLGQLDDIMALASGKGLPFKTILSNLFSYLGTTPTVITSGNTAYTNPYHTNEKVWPDTQGRTGTQALADLVVRGDGGQMGWLDPAVVWTRDALRPLATELTLDAEKDLSAPPELVFDQGAQVGTVTVKTTVGQAVATDPSAGAGQASFDSPLLDLSQASKLAEDRIASVRELRLSITRIVVDLMTTEGQWLLLTMMGNPLDNRRLTPATRVKLTGLPAAQTGAAEMSSYVLGADLDIGVDHCRLTLALAPADSPLEARVDDGALDQCSVAF